MAAVTGCALVPGSTDQSSDWPLAPEWPSLIWPSAWCENSDRSAALPPATEDNWVSEAGRGRRYNGGRWHTVRLLKLL